MVAARTRGFTLIELMLVVTVLGVLTAIAIRAYSDNSARARMSEVVLAASPCRMAVSDGWLRETVSPGPGNWGCESANVTTKYVAKVQTTSNGEVRVQVRNLNDDVNGLFVYLKPYETSPPPASGGGVFAPGKSVRAWKCGVATSDGMSMALLAVLPSTCRDTFAISGTAWGP